MLFNSTLDRLSENQLEVLVGENEAERKTDPRGGASPGG